MSIRRSRCVALLLAAGAICPAKTVPAGSGPAPPSAGVKAAPVVAHPQSGAGGHMGKKTRVDGHPPDSGRGQKSEADAGRPRSLQMRLGDRVRGRVRAGGEHRLAFEGLGEARLRLFVQRLNGETLHGSLLDPEGRPLATLVPDERDSSLLELADFALRASGVHTLVLACESGDAAYVLRTYATEPTTLEQDVAVAAGRPVRLTYGGCVGRILREARIEAAPGSPPLRPALRIVDPDGHEVAFEEWTYRSLDEGLVKVTELPCDRTGEYQLYVTDRDRRTGTMRVKLRFRNPPAGSRLLELE